MKTLKSKEATPGVYKVSYDDIVRGDERGFPTEELCNQEIRKRLAKDARDAVTYNRELLYCSDIPDGFTPGSIGLSS